MPTVRNFRITPIFNKIRYYLQVMLYSIARFIMDTRVRNNSRPIVLTHDLFAVTLAWFGAYAVLVGIVSDVSVSPGVASNRYLLVTQYQWLGVLINLAYILPAQFILFYWFGLYRGFWRFASIQDLRKIVYVSLLGISYVWLLLKFSPQQMTFIARFSSSSMIQLVYIPITLMAVLYGVFLILLLSAARLVVRFAKEYRLQNVDYQRVIIVGAGNAGEGLVRDLLRDQMHRYKPIAFVDDDKRKQGREIHSIRVEGFVADLPALIVKHKIDLVLIAIPSASAASMRSVFNVCERAKIRCFTLPSLRDLADGRVSINVLRSIRLEDLLGRYPVTCQWSTIKSNLKHKTILVTGGGGSIGSELCRQLASLDEIKKLIIVDSNEFNLYSIEMELSKLPHQYELVPILMSVTDRNGIKTLMRQHCPEYVFHAAAYKHVPLLENQPRIAIYNNIIGTVILADEAANSGVDTFVLISSDKAVNPTNVMGATKRAAEYYCQNMNDNAKKTKFVTVRFGNVLNSAGSVIPLFKQQIETGGPVTVTHPDITRYFMTIPEASQLILQAAFLGTRGEIFVLDMGDPIKISYLAEQMIRLAGKEVDTDIKITYTGLRPGEKLYEECFYSNETLQPTANEKILRAQSQVRDFHEIQLICQQLERCCQTENISNERLIWLLKKLVPDYLPDDLVEQGDITDNSQQLYGTIATSVGY